MRYVLSFWGLRYLYLSWLFVCFRWLAAINLVIIIICFNVNAFKISENSINNKTTCSCVLLMSYHEILHISFRCKKPKKPKTKTKTCRTVAKSQPERPGRVDCRLNFTIYTYILLFSRILFRIPRRFYLLWRNGPAMQTGVGDLLDCRTN